MSISTPNPFTHARPHKNSPRPVNTPLSPSSLQKHRKNALSAHMPNRSPPESPLRHIHQKHGEDVQLTLSRVIGTTATSSSTLDSIAKGRTFAFTAGAAAVLVSVGPAPSYTLTQRFYRAAPGAVPLNSIPASFSPLKDGNGTSRVLGSPFGASAAVSSSPSSFGHNSEWTDSYNSPKSWSSRERIKAASAVSLSPDGKFLAVGEVSTTQEDFIGY